LTSPAVVSLEVPDSMLMLRITGRRVCGTCRRTFNTYFSGDAIDAHSRECGGELIQRADDNPETVRERLRVYREQTAPVLSHYENSGKLSAVDGTGSMDEVFARIKLILSEQY